MKFSSAFKRQQFLSNIPLKSDFKFKFIDNFDISEIKKLLEQDGISSEKWTEGYKPLDEDQVKTENRNSSNLIADIISPFSQPTPQHKLMSDLSFRFVVRTTEFNNMEDPLIIYSLPQDQKLVDAIKPITNRLEQEFGDEGKLTRAYFARLVPGEIINQHTDLDFQDEAHQIYFKATHKYHIPITTNDKVWTMIDGEKKHLKVGECWDYNNNLPHSGANEGETDRIHLIIEISTFSWL